ncbi:ABC transporter substrate-binding protein [Microbacterium sp. E-13]|uniref:ABC transporter substrate-binding protein n=1 Tax=Microbacterium sp. E-13 TaxID=3404048 RepID=UPI003CE6E77D
MLTTSRRRRPARAIALLTGAVLLLSGCSAASAATSTPAPQKTPETVTITDELGREVELTVPITAVYPDLWYQSEIVRGIGAGDSIVAIESSTDPTTTEENAEYFADFADLPVVGNYEEPNWEAIVESGAQVALMRRNGPWEEAVEKLEPFGIDVVVVTTWDPIVLRKYLPLLGEIFGKEDGAAELASLYDDIDTTLDDALEGVDDPKSVYFENNAEYVTSVPGSGWHDTIELAGGENLFGDVNVGDDSSASVHQYEVDPVEVIARNPDVIVHNGVDGLVSGYEPWSASDLEGQAEAIAARPGWDATTAVQGDEVYVFDNFFYSALGKQVGALALASWLYPERFEDVDVDEYFGRWLTAQGVEPRSVSEYVYKLGQ